MLIGEVIEQSGVTRDTIRHYEAWGLIETPGRRENNYREYPPSTVNRVKFVRYMQRMGFTLRQTRVLLELYEKDAATCANTGPLIRTHVAQLDEKIAELVGMRKKLVQVFRACEGNSRGDDCTPIVSPLSGE